ncbi:MAG: hypothetical protein EXS25_03010 [Pedosphaera sp.]|nr:hypothetical protein [Pedosphaera sp.]
MLLHRLKFLVFFLLVSRSAVAGVRSLEAPTNQALFFSYALSSDGQWIAGGTGQRRLGGTTNSPVPAGQVVLWDGKSGKQKCVLGQHGATVNWMAFSKDGSILVSASGSTATLKIWSMTHQTLRHTLTLAEPVIASSTLGSQMVCALSPDGRRLAAVGATIKPIGISQTSEAATLTVWDTATGRVLWTLPKCGIGTMSFTPDAKVLVGFSRTIVWELVREVYSSRVADERLVGWEGETGQVRFSSPIPGMNPSHLVIPANTNRVLALSGNRNTWYSLETGVVTREQPLDLRQSLHVAAVSPEASQLFAIDFSAERLHFLRFPQGSSITNISLAGYTNRIMFAAVSEDFKRLAGTRNNSPVVLEF